MQTNLSGLALIPRLEDLRKFIEFRRQAGSELSGPMLSEVSPLPHVTILQCPFRNEILTKDTLDRIYVQAGLTKQLMSEAKYDSFHYQETGLGVFADVSISPWGEKLQQTALTIMEDAIDTDSIVIDNRIHVMRESERNNQYRYGYRYVGDDFLPHMTAGVAPSDEVKAPSERLLRLYAEMLLGQNLVFDRLIFYRAGQYGTAVEVLAEKQA